MQNKNNNNNIITIGMHYTAILFYFFKGHMQKSRLFVVLHITAF